MYSIKGIHKTYLYITIKNKNSMEYSYKLIYDTYIVTHLKI